jgi:hypothetical protein
LKRGELVASDAGGLRFRWRSMRFASGAKVGASGSDQRPGINELSIFGESTDRHNDITGGLRATGMSRERARIKDYD